MKQDRKLILFLAIVFVMFVIFMMSPLIYDRSGSNPPVDLSTELTSSTSSAETSISSETTSTSTSSSSESSEPIVSSSSTTSSVSSITAPLIKDETPSWVVQEKKEEDTRASVMEIVDYICSLDWDCDLAIKIAKCESSLNNLAINLTGADHSVGLFQINIAGSLAKNRPTEGWLLNYKNNIDYAYQMSKGGTDWSPWTCSR